jgi:hypothetical protein
MYTFISTWDAMKGSDDNNKDDNIKGEDEEKVDKR